MATIGWDVAVVLLITHDTSFSEDYDNRHAGARAMVIRCTWALVGMLAVWQVAICFAEWLASRRWRNSRLAEKRLIESQAVMGPSVVLSDLQCPGQYSYQDQASLSSNSDSYQLAAVAGPAVPPALGPLAVQRWQRWQHTAAAPVTHPPNADLVISR